MHLLPLSFDHLLNLAYCSYPTYSVAVPHQPLLLVSHAPMILS